MLQQRKTESPPIKRQIARNDEFLKYLKKRMRELEMEEKKFREIVASEKKVN
jgi:hypothetical protein